MHLNQKFLLNCEKNNLFKRLLFWSCKSLYNIYLYPFSLHKYWSGQYDKNQRGFPSTCSINLGSVIFPFWVPLLTQDHPPFTQQEHYNSDQIPKVLSCSHLKTDCTTPEQMETVIKVNRQGHQRHVFLHLYHCYL